MQYPTYPQRPFIPTTTSSPTISTSTAYPTGRNGSREGRTYYGFGRGGSERKNKEREVIFRQINQLLGQLEEKEAQLRNVMNDLDDLSLRIKSLVREVRWRKMSFYDTMLLKTLKYNNGEMNKLTSIMSRIQDAKNLLDSKVVRNNTWKLEYVTKKMTQENLLPDADIIFKQTKAKIDELTQAIRDMADENNIDF